MKVSKEKANSAALILKYSKHVRNKKLKHAAAVLLGNLGKDKTSDIKKKSSPLNGRLGGRPKKL